MDDIDIGSDFDDEELDVKNDDKFEDAGELDLSAAQDNILLTRMPKITWEALSALKDDDEIQVGMLRMEGDTQNPAKVSLMLDPNLSAFRLVPREYNMRAMNKATSNTFVFTEKDLPGYTRKVAGQGTQAGRPQPVEKKEGNSRRNFRTPGYRRAIPKKTALIGHVKSEYNCLPVENQQYVDILTRRQAETPKDDSSPQFIEGKVAMANILNPGGVGATNAFTGFIRTAPAKDKKQQQKAARIPKNELLDMLFDCFRQFRYWYLRDLRLRTQQPEAYLRETLEGIAELVRQGAHANTWRLRSGMAVGDSTFEAAAESVAPTTTGPEPPDDDDDDDDNVKMEDV